MKRVFLFLFLLPFLSLNAQRIVRELEANTDNYADEADSVFSKENEGKGKDKGAFCLE